MIALLSPQHKAMLKKFFRSLVKIATKPFYFNLSTKVGNSRFLIPIANGKGWSNLTSYEAWMVKLMGDILNFRQGAFIDVGANTGQTLIKLRSFSPDTPYIGFEVNVKSFLILKSVVDVNQLEGCTIIPIGLSNDFGVFPVWSAYEDGTFATIEKELVQNDTMKSQSLGVVAKLDNLIQTGTFENAIKEGIFCIKIDVEGHELEVLEGAADSLSKYRPFIIIEVLNHVLPHKKAAILDWVKANDYRIQSPNFNASSQVITYLKTDSFRTGEIYNPEESNYLLVPSEYEEWNVSK
jgi:FkbM family methyltransferase